VWFAGSQSCGFRGRFVSSSLQHCVEVWGNRVLSRENQITLKVGGTVRQGVLVNWKAVNFLIDRHIHSFPRLFRVKHRGRIQTVSGRTVG
jgi:hypothetical protein